MPGYRGNRKKCRGRERAKSSSVQKAGWCIMVAGG